ncbi:MULTISPECIES: methyltransferase domain-containing protein [Actinomadura]|uniref:Methyltransferase domain-containing protein n=1 Tax=Actinomadura litoris TaxID=2678616 RepID=A0A7K1LCZ6_9ACTN|nr:MULTISPECIES: methyltransferase domain-containing protein [Actinomadura]MBT2208441.1 methyltransferase domain-containing protein [Actinomadura sp. NEAU-AAG7]MUN42294.1 methyltransferase domain-containing protein [Actinomadura litoris]
MPARPPEPTIASLRDAPAEGAGDSLARYWTFYWAVADAQLTRWLPRRASRVLDLSGGGGRSAGRAAAAGHSVLEVHDPLLDRRPPARPAAPGNGRHDRNNGRSATRGATAVPVIGDSGGLRFVGDASMDAVIAENRVLSRHLATETTVAEIARVLRPGGRVLLCVDSLTLGMALLAEQNYWAHLSDVPSAEVVLVPWPDGTITRCFWADQLRELLTEVGLEVEWIRPRTALSPSTVEHVLSASPDALPRLVRSELNAPPPDDSLGIHLLASARRRSG